ncbi:hypothetical protein [Pseudoalteromonas sp. SR41-6]|uniref:hypothetical protein n=1 Tax=Pseudoalteromonas sp. SR41-6 TaxID=2760948 RepID=UPI0015FF9BBF|nr:hypothetical protein [Pseudoalteromonas sp. SR41-6]MBB1333932.1 hypothetical protein [Pseudoalteromonas sp. SR41-6]
MRVHKTNIRRTANRYLCWLQDQQWFQTNITNKDEWIEPIQSIISKKSDCSASIWEAVVDHWHATPWDEDNCNRLFQELYDLADEYRKLKGVDSTSVFLTEDKR